MKDAIFFLISRLGSMTQVSIKWNKLQKSDEGTYVCKGTTSFRNVDVYVQYQLRLTGNTQHD